VTALMLELCDVSLRRGKNLILDTITLSIGMGEFIAIVGPNGAGKSSLVNMMTGAQKADAGSIVFEGKPLSSWRNEDMALRRAVLSQSTHVTFPFTVFETLTLSVPDRASRARLQEVCAKALAQVGLSGSGHRILQSLSGGERQRVHLARVLVQLWISDRGLPQLLFLDEPVSNLDLQHQLQTITLARQLVGERLTVIAVVHDMNLALHFATRVICMAQGRIVDDGAPHQCLTPDKLAPVFGVSLTWFRNGNGMALLGPYDLQLSATRL
jgi:iron complex transport system ATP-binding protein